MLYDFDIPTLVRRYVPSRLRWPINLALGRVLTSWLGRIHSDFLLWRSDTIIAEYRYNGLVHSLERALNASFDAVQQRIYITVVDQVPVMHHAASGELATTAMGNIGQLTGYYHLAPGQAGQVYYYEFLVHVPADITFTPKVMFDLLDTYRFAGRRPAIRRFAADNSDVEIILYTGLFPPANEIGDTNSQIGFE